MPSLKALRTRIRSIKNTQQITKTMKMVAAAKVRRARNAVESARPYAHHLYQALAQLAQQAQGNTSPLLSGRTQQPGKPYTVRLVVCGTDRGLCGGLNVNLLKSASVWVAQQQAQGRTVQLVAVGRKIRDGLARMYGPMLVHTYSDMGRTVEFTHAQAIAATQRQAFEDGVTDEVHLLCAESLNMLTQQPSFRQLIPFGAATPAPEASHASGKTALPAGLQSSPDYEPDEETVLARLLPLNLNTQVFVALLETAASEFSARMTAMDNATRNAGEITRRLTIQYNRSRQGAITKELIEIISGAEAV